MNKLLAFAICGFVPLAAQQSPPPDDPGLLVMFFHFHSGLSSALDDKKTQDPSGGAKAEKAVAHTLKVQVSDLPQIAAVTHGFVADLDKLQKDLKAYVDESRGNKHEPDPVTLKQFAQKKQELIDAALRDLRTRLSTESWIGLHSYVNDGFRSHVRSVDFGTKP